VQVTVVKVTNLWAASSSSSLVVSLAEVADNLTMTLGPDKTPRGGVGVLMLTVA
jgi:hypothetical protein